jgi:class 3 adenylate cyclase/tetratricopeptide (TPR) repeat protein
VDASRGHGHGAASEADQAPTRRLVTALFCDVAGSTALGERLDPEAVRRIMRSYFVLVSTAVERHGGSVEKFIGDAVVGVFGVPRSHEDDALRGVRAAVEARDAVRAMADDVAQSLGVAFAVRIGLATGEVVAGGGTGLDGVLTGDTMNTAARLETAAPQGEVLVCASTYALVRGAVTSEPVEPLTVKGKAEPVAAHRILDVRPGADARNPHFEAAMIGRTADVQRVRAAFDVCRRDRRSGLVTILGSAGVGKSRLVAEVLANIGDDVVIAEGRCLSYGEGITYWPLAEVIAQLAGIEQGDSSEDVVRRIADLAGSTDPADIAVPVAALLGVAGVSAPIDVSRRAVRSLVETVASRGPLVLVFDDLHWAEPALLDLVEYIVTPPLEAPLFVVGNARPDLAEERPGLTGADIAAETVRLEPLGSEDSGALLAAYLGAPVPAQIASRIVTAAGGNPLFLEELAAMLVDQGLLRLDGDSVEVFRPIDELPLPLTISALLAARLDGLGAAERGVLDRAAVEGQVFHESALLALGAAPATLEADLSGLSRTGFVRRGASVFPGQRAHGFRHLLIREAAYRATAKERRAQWHEELADWVERLVGDRVTEHDEILAHHVFQAARYRSEIGETDVHTRSLARRAAHLYRRSADRALLRGEFLAGAALLRPIPDALPRGDPEAVLALCDRAWHLRMGFQLVEAADVAGVAEESAELSGDAGLVALAHVLRAMIEAVTSSTDAGRMEAAVSQARTAAEQLGAGPVCARLWMLVGVQEGYFFGRNEDAATASRLACSLALEAGEAWVEATARWHLALHIVRGPGKIDDVLASGRELIKGLGGAAEANYHADSSALLLARGDPDEAIALHERAMTMGREFWPIDELHGPWGEGTLLLDLDRPYEALPLLRRAFEGAQALRAGGEAQEIQLGIARALLLTGDVPGALAAADDASTLTDQRGDPILRGGVSGVRARALAATGHLDEAMRLVGGLLELARTSQSPEAAYTALMDAAATLEATADRDGACSLYERARLESEARDAHGYARRASGALARLDGVSRSPSALHS